MRVRTTYLRTRRRYSSICRYGRFTFSAHQCQRRIIQRAIVPGYIFRSLTTQRNTLHLRRWQTRFRSRRLVCPVRCLFQRSQQHNNPNSCIFRNYLMTENTIRVPRHHCTQHYRLSCIRTCTSADRTVQRTTNEQSLIFLTPGQEKLLRQFGIRKPDNHLLESFEYSERLVETSTISDINTKVRDYTCSSPHIQHNNNTNAANLYEDSSNIEKEQTLDGSNITDNSRFKNNNDDRSATSLLNLNMDARNKFSSTSDICNTPKPANVDLSDVPSSTLRFKVSLSNTAYKSELRDRNDEMSMAEKRGTSEDSNTSTSRKDHLNKAIFLHINASIPNNVQFPLHSNALLGFNDSYMQVSTSEAALVSHLNNNHNNEDDNELVTEQRRKWCSYASTYARSKTGLRWTPYDRVHITSTNYKRRHLRYVRSRHSGSSNTDEKMSGPW